MDKESNDQPQSNGPGPEAQESEYTKTKAQDPPAADSPGATTGAWPTYVPLPAPFPSADPFLRIFFRGLLTFCFDGSKQGEVGVIQNVAGTAPHVPVFRLWKKNPTCPALPTTMFTPKKSFELRVTKPLAPVNGVFVFEKDPGKKFDRAAATNDDRDFRWILDFESPDLHDTQLTKIAKQVGPRMLINSGLFYTFHRTQTFFNAHPASGTGGVKILSSVGEVGAANVYLEAGGKVEILIDGVVKDTLEKDSGFTYQFDVLNLCQQGASECTFVPAHPSDKTKRNDFYQYYTALDLTAIGIDEFELLAVQPTKNSTISDLNRCKLSGEDGTDPAPCGPGTFGRSPTFGP